MGIFLTEARGIYFSTERNIFNNECYYQCLKMDMLRLPEFTHSKKFNKSSVLKQKTCSHNKIFKKCIKIFLPEEPHPPLASFFIHAWTHSQSPPIVREWGESEVNQAELHVIPLQFIFLSPLKLMKL